MDSFINLAKQGYEAYSESQTHSNVSKTGGQEYNSPHHSQQDSQGDRNGPYINHEEAVQHAANHGSGDNSLFSSALSHLSQNKHEHTDPIDEEAVQRHHSQAYEKGDAGGLSAGSMGGAAAMQVLKQFTGGSGGGGGSSTQLVSMAMAEASKLFDKSGGASSGNKQDAINGAAMTVMKLMVQSKFGGGVGGGNSGGMGSLMGLASKFI